MIPVSGLTGQGVNDLIEAVALQSEIMNLRADQDTRAEGLVVDARVENGLGVVAECIIRWGKLEKVIVVNMIVFSALLIYPT
jgi:translation initiation factor IF-2